MGPRGRIPFLFKEHPMSSPAQIEANRRNAQKSTGPRTPEGKAVSSQNAFQSGIDSESQIAPGENPAELLKLQNEYFAHYRPQTPEERFHVDSIIRNEWLLRRLFRAEAQLWDAAAAQESVPQATPLGSAFLQYTPAFMRLQRRITLCERSREASVLKFKALQQERLTSPAPAFQPAEPIETNAFSDQIGFVPEEDCALMPGPDSPIVRLTDLLNSITGEASNDGDVEAGAVQGAKV
jgi:hypothetical protein